MRAPLIGSKQPAWSTALILSIRRKYLSALRTASIFKLYLFDIGLLHHMLGISATSILNVSFGSYKGYIAENLTAAQLVTAGIKELYTWKGRHISEIEET
ncbi:MAG: DUF4143 domain-containing protein [Spirochaetia bacterium]|nr:DUF4143 domain-containing protein [Spirochaetia bacterium]